MLYEACLRTINVSGQLSWTGAWTSDLHKFYNISISSMCFANILPQTLPPHNTDWGNVDGWMDFINGKNIL